MNISKKLVVLSRKLAIRVVGVNERNLSTACISDVILV